MVCPRLRRCRSGEMIKLDVYVLKCMYATKTYSVKCSPSCAKMAKSSRQTQCISLHPLFPKFPTKHSSRRRTLAAAAHDVVQHAVPDLSGNTNLLLDRFLDSRSHEIRDGVEVNAVGVAVMRVGHGQNDRERRGADDLGFCDDLFDVSSSCMVDMNL